MAKQIKLVKSLIGAKPAQKATAASLGLKKLGDSITLVDDACTAGKIKVLAHLLKVENV